MLQQMKGKSSEERKAQITRLDKMKVCSLFLHDFA
jgi:hypothetical protein